MKKVIIFLSIAFILLFGYLETTKTATAEVYFFENAVTTENVQEPTSTDSAIALLLNSYISKAIENYFGKPTQYALYDAKVKSITQVGTNFVYTITIDVPTFHGAHNPPYGLEILTFIVEPSGVTLIKYEHKDIAA